MHNQEGPENTCSRRGLPDDRDDATLTAVTCEFLPLLLSFGPTFAATFLN